MTDGNTLPATTYSAQETDAERLLANPVPSEPTTFPGPSVKGKPTSITLLSPVQLVKHALLPSFLETCNGSYRASHIDTGILPETLPRLANANSILTSVGTAASSFTLIIHYAGTHHVIATISLRQYLSIAASDRPVAEAGKTFERERPVPDDAEAWEIKLLTVGLEVQGQGLAVFLVQLGEDEARRRFAKHIASAKQTGTVAPTRLLFVLSAIKEEYYEFYLKRGYTFDYDVWFPIGTLGSLKPFTIAHLTKEAI